MKESVDLTVSFHVPLSTSIFVPTNVIFLLKPRVVSLTLMLIFRRPGTHPLFVHKGILQETSRSVTFLNKTTGGAQVTQ